MLGVALEIQVISVAYVIRRAIQIGELLAVAAGNGGAKVEPYYRAGILNFGLEMLDLKVPLSRSMI